MIPEPRTTSRHSGLSPAMLPSAHTTWLVMMDGWMDGGGGWRGKRVGCGER